jgi:hydroxymethylglutaryl-CoA lyase
VKTSAILFDLDGTLVDSERESAEAMARALAKGQGIRVDQSDRDFIIGRSWVEIEVRLRERYPALSWTRAELIAATAEHREEVFQEQGITILPGALEALRRFDDLPRGLVTGSSRAEAAQALRALGAESTFDVVVAAEDVATSKPDPQGYLQAAATLQVEPAACLVIEDSVAGIAAGIAAGMRVIAVAAGNFAGQSQKQAHHRVGTLDEVTRALLGPVATSAVGCYLPSASAMIFDSLPDRVSVYEVGPRDGLQNESRMVPTEDKIALIEALAATGLPKIEITSFVSPKWIPQLADAREVAERVERQNGVTLTALVPNRRGLDNAMAAGMKEVAVFLSASETHNKRNVNKTIAETLRAFEDVVDPAIASGLHVRAYVSTVFGCPYEGEVDPAQVLDLSRKLLDMGVYQISLGDTIGVANPRQVERVLQRVIDEVGAGELAVHFHDTQGTALANCAVALTMGITTVDSSIGGLGGCPYAPGASGNLATEDLVAMLHSMGVETGIDLDALVDCSRMAASYVGHELPSKYLKAHLGKRARARRQTERKRHQEDKR